MGRSKKISTQVENDKPPFQAPALRADMRRRAHHPRFVVAPYGEKTGFPEPYYLTPEGVEQVRTWAEQGVTIGSMANGLGVNETTLRLIRDRQPEVQAAIDAGRADFTTRISDMLMKHTEEGNVTTLLFLAKTRAGFVEQSGEVEGATPKPVNVNVNISIPAPRPLAEVERLIGRLPDAVDVELVDANALPAPAPDEVPE